MKILGNHLDEGTLESLGRAEQLNRNLSDLNELIEGGTQKDRQTDGDLHQCTTSSKTPVLLQR